MSTEELSKTVPLLPIQGLVFDLDGTLLLSDRSLGGYEPLPGAIDILTTLKERAMPFVVLTNGSAFPPAEHARRLRKIGLPVDDKQLLTPSSVTAYRMRHGGIERALVLGTRGAAQALVDAGIDTVFTGEPRATEVQAVYVGWHPDCGMKDIEAACYAVWAGAKLYVASDVPFFATKHGLAMGYSSAILGAIKRLTNAPFVLTGKPSPHALRFAARRLGLPIPRIGVVGDDPDVEILMARRCGALAVGVTTGVASFDEFQQLPQNRKPHHVLRKIGDLLTCGALAEIH
jgi:4-nitrophenyl phosphatase